MAANCFRKNIFKKQLMKLKNYATYCATKGLLFVDLTSSIGRSPTKLLISKQQVTSSRSLDKVCINVLVSRNVCFMIICTLYSEVESLRTHSAVLGLEVSSPRKLPCPRLEDSTIFCTVEILLENARNLAENL